jgi:proteic killer suppression protein
MFRVTRLMRRHNGYQDLAHQRGRLSDTVDELGPEGIVGAQRNPCTTQAPKLYFCKTEARSFMEFRDRDIELFWADPSASPPRRVPPKLRRVLYRKLQMLDAARDLRDLRVPPSNHLEKLQRDRAGQYSMRVNDQWRLCFTWTPEGAKGVEFRDYH